MFLYLKVLSVNGHTCVGIYHQRAVEILKAAGANIDMRIAREVVPARQNGHASNHLPPLPQQQQLPQSPSQPSITNNNVGQPTGAPSANQQGKRPPLDSTTTPDDSVSLSSLSQPASSHSQKSLLNKSSAVVSGMYCAV